ncbi:MAG: flagellin [Burkholderiales bacterium]|nr:flagellin [Burkholderiales bacterium]
MAAVLNSNVASLWASKNLQGAQNKMAASVERLSSGLRINRARDDAAGLGIANALTSQINGANQGVRNLNDGISMVQTAEGAIAAAQEMGQRILTLATQGANGTLGTADRTAIQNEMKQLLTAIDAIGGRTKFSGNALLAYDPGATGADASKYTAETEVNSSKFSFQVTNTTTDALTLSSAAFVNIGGTTGVTTSAALEALASDTKTFTLASAPASSIVGSTVYTWTTGASGVDGTYVKLGTVESVSGSTVTMTADSLAVYGASQKIVFGGLLTTELSATNGDLSLTRAVDATSLVDGTASTATAGFQMVQRAATAYITQLSTQRSLLGAYQNQIEFTVSNVNELSSNLSAARSNVQDTDYATETASLTKGQILQQAATAMLAQANQMPNVILSLLK